MSFFDEMGAALGINNRLIKILPKGAAMVGTVASLWLKLKGHIAARVAEGKTYRKMYRDDLPVAARAFADILCSDDARITKANQQFQDKLRLRLRLIKDSPPANDPR